VIAFAILSLWSAVAERSRSAKDAEFSDAILAMISVSGFREALRSRELLEGVIGRGRGYLLLSNEQARRALTFYKVGSLVLGEDTRAVGLRMMKALELSPAYELALVLTAEAGDRMPPQLQTVDVAQILEEVLVLEPLPWRAPRIHPMWVLVVDYDMDGHTGVLYTKAAAIREFEDTAEDGFVQWLTEAPAGASSYIVVRNRGGRSERDAFFSVIDPMLLSVEGRSMEDFLDPVIHLDGSRPVP
jgi:hypothetical protein